MFNFFKARKSTHSVTDEKLYTQVAEEIEADEIRPGLRVFQ
jgi:hypothetical protein